MVTKRLFMTIFNKMSNSEKKYHQNRPLVGYMNDHPEQPRKVGLENQGRVHFQPFILLLHNYNNVFNLEKMGSRAATFN